VVWLLRLSRGLLVGWVVLLLRVLLLLLLRVLVGWVVGL
jgi:hypothetical protein